MTDIRSALAHEIRRRAEYQRELAERDERSALQKRDLASVLGAVAMKLERGELDDRGSDLLVAARPPPFIFPMHGEKEESEVDRLRRIFGLDGTPLATAIGKLP